MSIHTDTQSSTSETPSVVFGGVHSSGTKPAIFDLRDGFRRIDFWHGFAWNDVRARYRRSFLGEFWIVLSLGIFVSMIGGIYSLLLGQPFATYLPRLAVTYVCWILFSTLATDGCQTFIAARPLLLQQRIPLTSLALRVVHRSFIVLAHNAVIIAAVFLLFGIGPDWSWIGLVPALMVWWINGLWLTMALGLISARFRDVPQLMTSILQILFLATPVLWNADDAPERLRIVADFNPVSHFMALVSEPLLRGPAPLHSWAIALVATAMGSVATFGLLSKYRARVAYWV